MIRSAAVAALVSLSLSVLTVPAQARLADPDTGSIIGGGLFGGVRLGPRTAQMRVDERSSELVGKACPASERVATQAGGAVTAPAQACE